MNPAFNAYIGIDYSGAGKPTSRLSGLRVFAAVPCAQPKKVRPNGPKIRNWTRKEVASWCIQQIRQQGPVLIGIDHAFSFPMSYMRQYGLSTWDQFLDDFQAHWPTDKDDATVEKLRHGNRRTGRPADYRLTEKWTSSTQSVFKLDGQGNVGKSSHAGIPWLRFIRRCMDFDMPPYFWPFDGFEIPANTSVITEVYPSIFRRRYPRRLKSIDEHDAWCIARWLQDCDANGFLARYFNPPLTPVEREQALLEGWILGVC